MQKSCSLPKDVATLQGMIQSLQAEVQFLAESLRLLRANAYGSKSETGDALGSGQLALFEDAETGEVDEEAEAATDDASQDDADESTEVVGYQRKKPGRKPLPEDLERVEVVHDIDEKDKVCGCGCALKRIGEETAEQLEVQPAKAYVTRHIRPKYACPACEGIETEGSTVKIARPPAQLLPKTMASATLLACLITAKYADSIPYYRQERQFSRLGIELSRGTMSNWGIQLAERIQPLWEILEKEARSGPVIQMDETTFQVMREPGRGNRSKSYMWIMRGGRRGSPVVIYRYGPTRSGVFARDWIGDYRGYVQTDGYAGYDFLDKLEGVKHLGCMAHVRRKFADVCKIGGKKRKQGLADKAIRLIKRLYRVESDIRERKMTHLAAGLEREKRAKPILEEFEALMKANQHKIPPRGTLGQAINYACNQMLRLKVYLEQGYLSIDNNRIENDIRPFVVGRKNWLFAGKPEGAQASAVWYSLIETAKANGREPFKYLSYLFSALPYARTEDDYRELLPTATL